MVAFRVELPVFGHRCHEDIRFKLWLNHDVHRLTCGQVNKTTMVEDNPVCCKKVAKENRIEKHEDKKTMVGYY